MTKRGVAVACFLIITIILLLFFGKKKDKAKDGLVLVESNIFKTDAGFGYNVLVDHKLFIHQQFIPAVQGNKSFEDKEDAQKIADLVVQKIVHSQQPVISVEEIDSLKINH